MTSRESVLNFSRLSPVHYHVGVRCLGVVTSVSNSGINLALPHGVSGVVPVGLSCDSEQAPILPRLYRVGEYLPAIVESADGSGKLTLSIRPSGFEQKAPGLNWAVVCEVKSEEEYGWLMSLGDGVQGFLSRDRVPTGEEDYCPAGLASRLVPGYVCQCTVVETGHNVVQLSMLRLDLQAAAANNAYYKLIPGQFVKAEVLSLHGSYSSLKIVTKEPRSEGRGPRTAQAGRSAQTLAFMFADHFRRANGFAAAVSPAHEGYKGKARVVFVDRQPAVPTLDCPLVLLANLDGLMQGLPGAPAPRAALKSGAVVPALRVVGSAGGSVYCAPASLDASPAAKAADESDEDELPIAVDALGGDGPQDLRAARDLRGRMRKVTVSTGDVAEEEEHPAEPKKAERPADRPSAATLGLPPDVYYNCLLSLSKADLDAAKEAPRHAFGEIIKAPARVASYRPFECLYSASLGAGASSSDEQYGGMVLTKNTVVKVERVVPTGLHVSVHLSGKILPGFVTRLHFCERLAQMTHISEGMNLNRVKNTTVRILAYDEFKKLATVTLRDFGEKELFSSRETTRVGAVSRGLVVRVIDENTCIVLFSCGFTAICLASAGFETGSMADFLCVRNDDRQVQVVPLEAGTGVRNQGIEVTPEGLLAVLQYRMRSAATLPLYGEPDYQALGLKVGERLKQGGRPVLISRIVAGGLVLCAGAAGKGADGSASDEESIFLPYALADIPPAKLSGLIQHYIRRQDALQEEAEGGGPAAAVPPAASIFDYVPGLFLIGSIRSRDNRRGDQTVFMIAANSKLDTRAPEGKRRSGRGARSELTEGSIHPSFVCKVMDGAILVMVGCGNESRIVAVSCDSSHYSPYDFVNVQVKKIPDIASKPIQGAIAPVVPTPAVSAAKPSHISLPETPALNPFQKPADYYAEAARENPVKGRLLMVTGDMPFPSALFDLGNGVVGRLSLATLLGSSLRDGRGDTIQDVYSRMLKSFYEDADFPKAGSEDFLEKQDSLFSSLSQLLEEFVSSFLAGKISEGGDADPEGQVVEGLYVSGTGPAVLRGEYQLETIGVSQSEGASAKGKPQECAVVELSLKREDAARAAAGEPPKYAYAVGLFRPGGKGSAQLVLGDTPKVFSFAVCTGSGPRIGLAYPTDLTDDLELARTLSGIQSVMDKRNIALPGTLIQFSFIGEEPSIPVLYRALSYNRLILQGAPRKGIPNRRKQEEQDLEAYVRSVLTPEGECVAGSPNVYVVSNTFSAVGGDVRERGKVGACIVPQNDYYDISTRGCPYFLAHVSISARKPSSLVISIGRLTEGGDTPLRGNYSGVYPYVATTPGHASLREVDIRGEAVPVGAAELDLDKTHFAYVCATPHYMPGMSVVLQGTDSTVVKIPDLDISDEPLADSERRAEFPPCKCVKVRLSPPKAPAGGQKDSEDAPKRKEELRGTLRKSVVENENLHHPAALLKEGAVLTGEISDIDDKSGLTIVIDNCYPRTKVYSLPADCSERTDGDRHLNAIYAVGQRVYFVVLRHNRPKTRANVGLKAAHFAVAQVDITKLPVLSQHKSVSLGSSGAKAAPPVTGKQLLARPGVAALAGGAGGDGFCLFDDADGNLPDAEQQEEDGGEAGEGSHAGGAFEAFLGASKGGIGEGKAKGAEASSETDGEESSESGESSAEGEPLAPGEALRFLNFGAYNKPISLASGAGEALGSSERDVGGRAAPGKRRQASSGPGDSDDSESSEDYEQLAMRRASLSQKSLEKHKGAQADSGALGGADGSDGEQEDSEDRGAGVNPRSPEDFERALAARENRSSSLLWIKYMSYYLDNAELDAARAVAERALRRIPLSEDLERRNVWLARVAMEERFGTPEAAAAVMDEALKRNDPNELLLQYCQGKTAQGDLDRAREAFATLLSKKERRRSLDNWLAYMDFLYKVGDLEKARGDDLRRAVSSLPEFQHQRLFEAIARMEYAGGHVEKGRAVFEELVKNSPGKIDVWGRYLDLEEKYCQDSDVRALYDRCCALNISSRRLLYFFKRYYKFEQRRGNAVTREHVRHLAHQYIESQ